MTNEDWIIEVGDEIIQKKADQGKEKLSKWETLVYCLWVADYGMRNAGDLDTAQDLYADFKREGLEIALTLGLKITEAAFALNKRELETRYFDVFDRMCDEVKAAKTPNTPLEPSR